MEYILRQLKELGLSEKESRVYVALVEIGKGTAYAIAKQAKVKRPTTYLILDDLRTKGLVLKIPHAKNQIFIAKDPNELFALQEEKLKNARRILPELLARMSGNNKASTLLFEGKEGVKEALAYKRDTLKNKELLAFYAKADKGAGGISKMYFDHDTALAQQKTIIQAFAPEHASLKEFRKTDNLKERRIITLPDSEFFPNVSMEIAPEFVKIILHKNTQALIVENKEFATLLTQVFTMLWKEKVNK